MLKCGSSLASCWLLAPSLLPCGFSLEDSWCLVGSLYLHFVASFSTFKLWANSWCLTFKSAPPCREASHVSWDCHFLPKCFHLLRVSEQSSAHLPCSGLCFQNIYVSHRLLIFSGVWSSSLGALRICGSNHLLCPLVAYSASCVVWNGFASLITHFAITQF